MKKINVRQLNLLKLSKVRGNKYRLERRQKKVIKHQHHKFGNVKNLNRQVFIDHVENCMKVMTIQMQGIQFL